jgi:hypothetical protein
VSERHFGWPSYLALLVAVTVACEFVFEWVGLSPFELSSFVVFLFFTIIWDFFAGETPSRERREEEA